jgi:hypothetical protein
MPSVAVAGYHIVVGGLITTERDQRQAGTGTPNWNRHERFIARGRVKA